MGAPDKGCRLAKWYPGFSPIYISLDGRTAAHEIMFSVDFVSRLINGSIPNPYVIGYPQVCETALYSFVLYFPHFICSGCQRNDGCDASEVSLSTLCCV